jgi:hypothetical protein
VDVEVREIVGGDRHRVTLPQRLVPFVHMFSTCCGGPPRGPPGHGVPNGTLSRARTGSWPGSIIVTQPHEKGAR